jgi:M6 family metalloprotease-like protein
VNRPTRFFVFLLLLSISHTAQSAYIKNHSFTATQPNGAELTCYVTGDEFYHRVHDKNNYTIVQDPATGYYVYAVQDGDEIKPSAYVAGSVDPSTVGLRPKAGWSGRKIMAMRRQAEQARAQNPACRIQPLNKAAGAAQQPLVVGNLFVFVRFSDQAEFTGSVASYDSMYNSDDPNVQSVNGYLKEVSYNKVQSTTYFLPPQSGSTILSFQDSQPRGHYQPYSVLNPAGYYGRQEQSMRTNELIVRVLQTVKKDIPANTILDGDGNGLVDNITFLINGGADNWSDLLWPSAPFVPQDSVQTWDIVLNGKIPSWVNFLFQEYFYLPTLCHEGLHSFNIADYYVYADFDDLEITPLGPWDIMAGGDFCHPNAFIKWAYVPWIDSIPEITQSGRYTLKPLTSPVNNAYFIHSPNSTDEYFMLEYRRQHGVYESTLPGSGLLIYRINKTRFNLYGNANADGKKIPFEIYVYRPGGEPTAGGTVEDAYFSGQAERIRFNNSTDPYDFLSNGQFGDIEITNVSDAADSITFTVNLAATPGVKFVDAGEFYTHVPGETTSFAWAASAIDNVALEYSDDWGETWHSIVSSWPAATGRYEWLVPNEALRWGSIRIRNLSDPDLFDETALCIVEKEQHPLTLLDFHKEPGMTDLASSAEYLYLTNKEGQIEIFSLADPTRPMLTTVISETHLTTGIRNLVDFHEQKLYCRNAEASNQLEIIDVANPAAPQFVKLLENLPKQNTLAFQDHRIYVATKTGVMDSAFVNIIDLQDSDAPTITTVKLNNQSSCLFVQGDFLYSLESSRSDFASSLHVYDLTNPLEPRETFVASFESYLTNPVLRDRYLFIPLVEEVGIWDLSNPALPKKISAILRDDSGGVVYHLAFSGDYAYLDQYHFINSYITVIDIHDLQNLKNCGSFEITSGFHLPIAVKNNCLYAMQEHMGLMTFTNALITGVEEKGAAMPEAFTLAQNHPNPFNPSTIIAYSLPKETKVRVTIYNTMGQEVIRLLDDKKQDAGQHVISWNGRDAAGRSVGTGLYFYQLDAGDRLLTKKMLLMK